MVYIRGKLTYLEGSRNRWRSFLTQKNYNLIEYLGYVGHLIIFLVTLSQIANFAKSFQNQTDHMSDHWQAVLYAFMTVLHNPWVYVTILLLWVGYLVFYYVVEHLWYYIYKLIAYLRRTRR